jgi:hypothetical protein
MLSHRSVVSFISPNTKGGSPSAIRIDEIVSATGVSGVPEVQTVTGEASRPRNLRAGSLCSRGVTNGFSKWIWPASSPIARTYTRRRSTTARFGALHVKGRVTDRSP